MSIESAIAELGRHLGDRLGRTEAIREQHGQDESWHAPHLPDAVVWPLSTEEVSLLARTCNAHGCPITAWGAGTSLEGHAIPVRGGVSLDLSRMDRVLEVHPEDMDVVVQPGITRKRLNEELRDTGLFFPVDPGADATIGGMASTRASGTCAVRYGTMREAVLALEVVLADGRVIRTGTRARKSSAGYDLTRLFVGSEGTLGIITEITVRLHGQPEAVSAAICTFPTTADAVNTVIQTIQMGIPVARMEFVDAPSIRAVNQYSNYDMAEQPTLFMEFHGTPAGVSEQAETVGEIAAGNSGSDFEWTVQPEDRNRLWAARHNYFYGLKAMVPGKKGLATDACVPISRLAECIDETERDMGESPLFFAIIGHVGDGNFHVSLMIDP
ncbi:MAG TPA: FAD-binding protein, partial [Paracoccaceae bacterium]|nr:FAD-binding protein [Paracoccaceae bacterium]